jgi:hypothetical protein
MVLPEGIDQLYGIGNDLCGRVGVPRQGYDAFQQVDHDECCFFLSIIRIPGIPDLTNRHPIKFYGDLECIEN